MGITGLALLIRLHLIHMIFIFIAQFLSQATIPVFMALRADQQPILGFTFLPPLGFLWA